MDSYSEIGQRIKQCRKERGLSQDEVAEGICSRQTISLLENGQHLPSIEIIQKISDKLAIPLDEIFEKHTSELETKTQVDIAKIYVTRSAFDLALPIIERLEKNHDLLEYQRRELILYGSECLMRTGRAEIAVENLSVLLQKLELERESDDYFMATLQNKLGNAYYFASNMLFAHSHYVRAYHIASRFQEPNLLNAQINYNLGNVCIWLGNYSEATKYLSLAQSFFDSADDPSRYATTLFSLGLSHHGLKDYESANRYLQESLAIFTSLQVHNMAQRARQQYASLVLAQQDPREAIRELSKCVLEFERIGDKVRLAYNFAVIASLYMDLNEFDTANQFVQRSLQLFDDHEAQKDPKLAYVYRIYTKYLFAVSDLDKAIEFGLKSSDFFAKMGIERDAADSLQIVADAYRMKGELSIAFDTMQRVSEFLRRSQERSFLVEGRNYQ